MSVEPSEAGQRLIDAIQAWCSEEHGGQDLMVLGAYVIAEVTRVDGTSWLHNGGLDSRGAQDTANWQRAGWLSCALWNEQVKFIDVD